jgi:hypothetical protein
VVVVFCVLTYFLQGKRRKFDKKSAAHFVLVHRSQRDSGFSHEEGASKFVLKQVNGPGAGDTLSMYEGTNIRLGAARTSAPVEFGDMVNELGFETDGYDYTQHLAGMSGGMFIAADGTFVTNNAHVIPEVNSNKWYIVYCRRTPVNMIVYAWCGGTHAHSLVGSPFGGATCWR